MTLNEQEQRRLCELYVSGLSSTELAPEFGCSHWFVLKTLRLNGIKRRPVGTGAKDLKSIKRAEDLMSNRHKILALYEKEVAICKIGESTMPQPKPLPPDVLVSALQDPIHQEESKVRKAHSHKVRITGCESCNRKDYEHSQQSGDKTYCYPCWNNVSMCVYCDAVMSHKPITYGYCPECKSSAPAFQP